MGWPKFNPDRWKVPPVTGGTPVYRCNAEEATVSWSFELARSRLKTHQDVDSLVADNGSIRCLSAASSRLLATSILTMGPCRLIPYRKPYPATAASSPHHPTLLHALLEIRSKARPWLVWGNDPEGLALQRGTGVQDKEFSTVIPTTLFGYQPMARSTSATTWIQRPANSKQPANRQMR